MGARETASAARGGTAWLTWEDEHMGYIDHIGFVGLHAYSLIDMRHVSTLGEMQNDHEWGTSEEIINMKNMYGYIKITKNSWIDDWNDKDAIERYECERRESTKSKTVESLE